MTDYEKASADLKRYLPLKVATLVWFLAVFGVATYAIAATWQEWWPYDDLGITNLNDARPAIYASVAGLLGATVYAFRGFYWAVGPQSADVRKYQYDPNWTWWYIARPLLGIFLGAFAHAIVRGGLATFGGSFDVNSPQQAAHFALGFLAGFAATEVLAWFSDAATRIFKKGGDNG